MGRYRMVRESPARDAVRTYRSQCNDCDAVLHQDWYVRGRQVIALDSADEAGGCSPRGLQCHRKKPATIAYSMANLWAPFSQRSLANPDLRSYCWESSRR